MRGSARRWVERQLGRQPRARLLSLIVQVSPVAGLDTVLVRGRNGEVFVPMTDPVISRAYLHDGAWSQCMVNLMASTLQGGGTLLDIGANLGLTTVPIAHLPGVRVIAFEPHPGNLQHLRASLAWNDLSERVDVHAVALADTTGAMPLEISPANIGDHRLRVASPADADAWFHEDSRVVISVPVQRLDDMVDLTSLPRPLVVKMDVQGAEGLVLDGGREVIAAADLLVVEHWPYGLRRLGCDPAAHIDELAGLFTEFALVVRDDDNPEVEFRSIADSGDELRRAAAAAAASSAAAHLDIALRGTHGGCRQPPS